MRLRIMTYNVHRCVGSDGVLAPERVAAVIAQYEPDVVALDKKTGAVVFFDCAAESPTGRRSVCFDREGLESRKEHKPADSAMDMAAAMGIVMLSEAEYRDLQKLGEFDLKTSSWILTPPDVRALGGALFCDRRYGKVFVYHNGAQSYYAARGFRGSVQV